MSENLEDGGITDEELALRVAYAFVQAAAGLGLTLGMSLKSFERMAHMGAFHVLRDRGLDLGHIAELLGVSRRKVDELSRRLKDNFFHRLGEAEAGEARLRRIEFALWAQPLTEARLKQVLPDMEDGQIEVALERLVHDGRLEVIEGRRPQYKPTTPRRRLVRDDWLARIDALNHQLSAVTGAAFSRFFRRDDRAFARTVSMRVRRDRMERLEALYKDVIWPALVELDAECQGLPESEIEALQVSLCWAPADLLADAPPGGGPLT